jgi:hypothetical protein
MLRKKGKTTARQFLKSLNKLIKSYLFIYLDKRKQIHYIQFYPAKAKPIFVIPLFYPIKQLNAYSVLFQPRFIFPLRSKAAVLSKPMFQHVLIKISHRSLRTAVLIIFTHLQLSSVTFLSLFFSVYSYFP